MRFSSGKEPMYCFHPGQKPVCHRQRRPKKDFGFLSYLARKPHVSQPSFFDICASFALPPFARRTLRLAAVSHYHTPAMRNDQRVSTQTTFIKIALINLSIAYNQTVDNRGAVGVIQNALQGEGQQRDGGPKRLLEISADVLEWSEGGPTAVALSPGDNTDADKTIISS
jgi:hypothetical protein